MRDMPRDRFANVPLRIEEILLTPSIFTPCLMPASLLRRLFQRFWELDPARFSQFTHFCDRQSAFSDPIHGKLSDQISRGLYKSSYPLDSCQNIAQI